MKYAKPALEIIHLNSLTNCPKNGGNLKEYNAKLIVYINIAYENYIKLRSKQNLNVFIYLLDKLKSMKLHSELVELELNEDEDQRIRNLTLKRKQLENAIAKARYSQIDQLSDYIKSLSSSLADVEIELRRSAKFTLESWFKLELVTSILVDFKSKDLLMLHEVGDYLYVLQITSGNTSIKKINLDTTLLEAISPLKEIGYSSMPYEHRAFEKKN